MINTILESFDIWTRSQTIKSNGRTAGVDNQRLLGIDKLRELILELAVRGKLVPQDEKDEPAIKYLKNIESERNRLIKGRKVKTPKMTLETDMPIVYFDLPKGWALPILSDILLNPSEEIVDGPFGSELKATEYVDAGIPIIRIQNIDRNIFKEKGIQFITEKKAIQLKRHNFIAGDIVLNKLGEPAGKACIVPPFLENGIIVADIIRIRINEISVNKQFLIYALNSPLVAAQFTKLSKGVTRQRVNLSQVRSLKVPLPPLAEQHRIVAKVDELMALCDQLEQQQTESNATHHQLVELLLQNLTEASDPEAFAIAWQRIAVNFDTLFTTEYSIDQLKQTILQLAVMGKLVPQDPKDEPASELLKKIAKEKERLVKEGKIKKQEKLPEITDEEKPFELPRGWEWVRFSTIFYELKYGTSKVCDYNIKGLPVLRIPNVVSGKIDSSDLKFAEFSDDERRELSLKEDDILLIRSNGSSSIVGRSTIVDIEHIGYLYAGYLVRVRFNAENYCSSFIKLVLDSQFVREQIEGPLRTTSGVKNINSSEISRIIMPSVPLSEQRRIVSKVDELFAFCDALKERIKEAQEAQGKLAEGVVGEIVLRNFNN